jgi:dTDP-4-amino-4,6-dideoxygalactose transaminase
MIQMNDFKAEPVSLLSKEIAAVERVLRSGWFVLGNELHRFEQAWALRCGVAHTVGVGNGMDAIEIGLRTLGISEGDEVITTAMTAFASVLAIIRSGAKPVLADIDPNTGLLDPESVIRCINPKTKVLLLVHLYGQVREMALWADLCRDFGINLVEDCAQAHLACWAGKMAGSFGRFGAYSFYPTKNLGARGDGGAFVSNECELAQRARVLRNYGQNQRYVHTEIGLNSRLDEIQAALLSVRLEYLDEFTQRRRQIAGAYRAGITNPRIRLLAAPLETDNHVYHLFVIICNERDKLSQHLKNLDIESLIHYPIPIHLQKPCLNLQSDPKGLQATEIHAENCLSLPCHPHLSDEDINYVIDQVNAFK